mmetsp:Transcript_9766/g.24323  ORF Transcript_9766/g.24323 Transcript_9766/m.24323 type:complete len:214 (-) Transcript_9766:766-1407(-)
MVNVLFSLGVEGIDRPAIVLTIFSSILFEGGNIGGLTIGGLPPTGFFMGGFFALGSAASPDFTLTSLDGCFTLSSVGTPTSEAAFLFFPNMPKKLLAILPASLAAGVFGNDLNVGTDFVVEGRLGATVVFPFFFRMDTGGNDAATEFAGLFGRSTEVKRAMGDFGVFTLFSSSPWREAVSTAIDVSSLLSGASSVDIFGPSGSCEFPRVTQAA